MMLDRWEVAHIGVVVDDLERWMEVYDRLAPGHWTTIFRTDVEVVAPLTDSGRQRIVNRSAMWTGQNPPLELLEGPEGSAWHTPPGTQRLDHYGYWGFDLDAQGARLQEIGYQVEFTLPSELPGKLEFFGYFMHPEGLRVEIVSDAFRPQFERWLAGGPLSLAEVGGTAF